MKCDKCGNVTSKKELKEMKRKKDEAHEALLKKYGFEPATKEEMQERLDELEFML